VEDSASDIESPSLVLRGGARGGVYDLVNEILIPKAGRIWFHFVVVAFARMRKVIEARFFSR
jgi:hypothetical protein